MTNFIHYFFATIIVLFCFSCQHNEDTITNNSTAITDTIVPNSIAETKAVYSYKIFKNDDHTFGYDIYSDSVKTFHQPTIPAIQGNKGFATHTDAESIARLCIQKLNNNIMPPTISVEELKNLHISQ